jgi:hypothetical protein
MAKKLSDLLSVLASKTKSVEDKIAKAREESGETLNKRIEESKAALQRKKDEYLSHAEAVNNRTKEGWDYFKQSLTQKAAHVKAEVKETKETAYNKVYEKKQALTAESAERQYNHSVDYATCCIEWASVALSEVESATLESFAAKQRLDALKNQTHSFADIYKSKT